MLVPSGSLATAVQLRPDAVVMFVDGDMLACVTNSGVVSSINIEMLSVSLSP